MADRPACAGILVYLVWKRQNLIGAMLTGRKLRADVVFRQANRRQP